MISLVLLPATRADDELDPRAPLGLVAVVGEEGFDLAWHPVPMLPEEGDSPIYEVFGLWLDDEGNITDSALLGWTPWTDTQYLAPAGYEAYGVRSVINGEPSSITVRCLRVTTPPPLDVPPIGMDHQCGYSA